MQFVKNFLKDEQGQDLVEYTLLLGFIALASAALFNTVGDQINTIWDNTSTQLENAGGGTGGG